MILLLLSMLEFIVGIPEGVVTHTRRRFTVKRIFLFVVGGVFLLSVLVIGCSAPADDAETSTAAPQPLLNINDDGVSASAEVVAGKWANLSFMLGAEKVSLSVKTGDQVKAGDILASFPYDFLPQSLINAKADLILAQKSLDDLLDTDAALAQAVIAFEKRTEGV